MYSLLNSTIYNNTVFERFGIDLLSFKWQTSAHKWLYRFKFIAEWCGNYLLAYSLAGSTKVKLVCMQKDSKETLRMRFLNSVFRFQMLASSLLVIIWRGTNMLHDLCTTSSCSSKANAFFYIEEFVQIENTLEVWDRSCGSGVTITHHRRHCRRKLSADEKVTMQPVNRVTNLYYSTLILIASCRPKHFGRIEPVLV